jgi:hypothetical protein
VEREVGPILASFGQSGYTSGNMTQPLRPTVSIWQKSVALLAAVGLLVVPALAAAETMVTQGYGVSGNLQKGMIVMLDPKDASKVQAANGGESDAIQGVVVAANEAAFSLGNDASAGDQVYVATTGKYDVLVSDQNGRVKAGDFITISALDGIGMKADSEQSIILGKALEGFDGSNNVISTTKLTTSAGTKSVSLGLIQVDVGVSHNPLASGAGSDAFVPGFLRKLAQTIAGKPVSAARIYISLAILLLTIVISGSLLYGGVRSSLVSIGRNPLAKRSVLRGLTQVMLIGVIILVIGLIAIYLLLKV